MLIDSEVQAARWSTVLLLVFLDGLGNKIFRKPVHVLRKLKQDFGKYL
jgi:hypothetical protein